MVVDASLEGRGKLGDRPLHALVFEWENPAAIGADVVMMVRSAGEGRIVVSDTIPDLQPAQETELLEDLQVPVDRGAADRLTGSPQVLGQLIRSDRAAHLPDRRDDLRPGQGRPVPRLSEPGLRAGHPLPWQWRVGISAGHGPSVSFRHRVV